MKREAEGNACKILYAIIPEKSRQIITLIFSGTNRDSNRKLLEYIESP
jgi:hypothetical protein